MKPLDFARVLGIRLMSDSATGNAVTCTRKMSLLTEYRPPEWAKRLKNIPQYKVKLANPATPIHRWALPGLPKHIQLSIKRDDMTGSTLSGNKVRKLEFLMADAIQTGCGHVITCGGIQSNHCRAVAVCARQLGLKPHLVLRATIQSADEVGCDGNLMLDRMCGAQLYMVPAKSSYLTELKPRMEWLAEYLKKTTGEKSYHIPVGGSNGVGVFGYISVFEELISQDVLEDYDDLVFACGSGGTAAGLSIANYLTGSKLRVHAVSVSDNAEYFHNHCNEMLQEMGLSDVRSEDILNVIDGYKGLGYGLSTQEEMDFVVTVSSNTGIMLDPVYTGKAARGLVKELQSNPGVFNGKRILFIHTGGIFGLMDGRMSETLKSQGFKANSVTMWQNKTVPPF